MKKSNWYQVKKSDDQVAVFQTVTRKYLIEMITFGRNLKEDL